jgi:hypothetical protein
MVMKTLHNLIIAGILFITAPLSVAANHALSNLTFRHQDHRPMVVEIDHVRYPAAQQKFHIDGIAPGRHMVTVFSAHPYHFGAGHVLFSGFIDIPAASEVRGLIKRNGTFRYLETTPLYSYAPVANPYPGYHPAPYLPVVDPARFAMLRDAVASRNFDSTRLTVARQIVAENNLSSRQVAELANLLNFDSSRLQFAKYAYRYVADPENYFVLFDVFSFDSSVRELSEYMGHQG